MNFQLVKVHEIDALWPKIGPGLGVALRRSGGDMSLGALFQQCRSGTASVLLAFDDEVKGAAVFRPEVWETGSKLRCLAMFAQDFRAWKHEAAAAMMTLKEAIGANAVIFEGRVGHEKLFPEAKVLRQLYEVK